MSGGGDDRGAVHPVAGSHSTPELFDAEWPSPRRSEMQTELTRRRLLAATGASLTGAMTFRTPRARAQAKITIGVGGWAVELMTEVLETLGFTEQTGIEVEVLE